MPNHSYSYIRVMKSMSTPDFSADVEACVKTLQTGGVILYPTDTIWGLGCDPRNAAAVARIFELKRRPPSKSILLLAADEKQVEDLVGELPEGMEEQISAAGKPLTIVYPHAAGLAEGVCAADGSVGIRIPEDDFCHALTEAFGGALTSTSANISEQAFDGSFQDVPESIREGVDYVVNWKQEVKEFGEPSRIVKWMGEGEWKLIRP